MMARSLARAAAAALIALLPAAALAQAPLTWHHGILEAKSDAGIFMMVQQGFAEKQGLKLDLFQFKSDAVGPARPPRRRHRQL